MVEFFYGWPDAALVSAAPCVGWQVGSADEARAAADAGCAYVIAQGVEAGGHVRGRQTMVQVLDEVCSSVDVPVVAAGGIGTAEAVRAALDGGADAVRVGTRFVAAAESDAHPGYVEALVASTGADTVLTETFSVGWPDAPTACWPPPSPGPRPRRPTRSPRCTSTGRAWSPSPASRPARRPPRPRATSPPWRSTPARPSGTSAARQPAAEIVAELTAAL